LRRKGRRKGGGREEEGRRKGGGREEGRKEGRKKRAGVCEWLRCLYS